MTRLMKCKEALILIVLLCVSYDVEKLLNTFGLYQ